VRTKQSQSWGWKTTLIKKDGGEMLIAIVLDRLVEAKALVEAPDAFIQAITRIMQDARQTESPSYCTNDQAEAKR